MPRSCCAACPTGRESDHPAGLTPSPTVAGRRSEVGHRLSELLGLRRRPRRRRRRPRPGRLGRARALLRGRGCGVLARARRLVHVTRPSEVRPVNARDCPLARR